MDLNHYAKGRKSYSTVYILYDSISVKYLLKAKLWRQKDQWLLGAEMGTGINLESSHKKFFGCWICTKTRLWLIVV